MLKNLLTLYFSFYLALSPIFAQANSTPQIANQFNHKVPTQNITINSDGTIINSSNITSKQNTNTNDNRAGHYGEDNNIYLNDANLNNTKDLTTTIGHETSHALDNQDPSINTNPQNNASKTDNEIYADNYGDDFGDYVEFASENYGNGNLASTNNRNLGNTPAERQRNTKLVERNNQDYARIDKSKGEDSAIIRYATPILKDPSSAIKIVENGLKAIGVIAGAEIVNHVSDSAQDDVSDIPEIDDVSEVAGTGAPMPDGEPSEDWGKKEQKRIKREEKKAQKEYKTNKDFRDYMHREYKPNIPKGLTRNRDLTSSEMRDAWLEYTERMQ